MLRLPIFLLKRIQAAILSCGPPTPILAWTKTSRLQQYLFATVRVTNVPQLQLDALGKSRLKICLTVQSATNKFWPIRIEELRRDGLKVKLCSRHVTITMFIWKWRQKWQIRPSDPYPKLLNLVFIEKSN